jgi:hypothetical protein
MSILAKLFSKRASTGRVRQHLTHEIERLERNQLNFTDSFTLCVFGPLESFASRNGSPIHELSPYTSDTALFELACYVHARCDVWLFAHAPDLRLRIITVLSARFASLFQTTLALSDGVLGGLLTDRMEVYGKLFSTHADVRDLHSLLAITMHNSLKRGLPYQSATTDIPAVDALLDFTLKTELIAWDGRFLPCTNDALKQAVDKLRSTVA